jgi:hypothetical protein
MLPAGFEPASEARKAPILDRTRLRERNGGLAAGTINAFGTAAVVNGINGKFRWHPLPSMTHVSPRRPTITELSFFACGVLIIFVGWVSDFLGIFEVGSSTAGHGPAGAFSIRIFMTMFGVAFATIGIGFENFPKILMDGEAARRHVIALLFLADGSLHLYAFTDHLNEAFPATFFAVVSVLQLVLAFVIPYVRLQFAPVWFAVTGFLILAYLVTRTVAVWPIGTVEEVDALGLVSKTVEVLTILALWSLLRTQRAARAGAAGPLVAPEP